jgi:hypothetical protein
MARFHVALIGDPTRPSLDRLPEEELYRPYFQRESIKIEAEEAEHLRDLLARAAAEFGLKDGWHSQPQYLGFFRPEDELGEPPKFSFAVPAIDADGVSRWRPPPHDFPIAELIRARDEGFLYGDPHRLHIAMVPAVGDGVLPDWQTLAHILEVMKTAAELLALPGGAASTWALFRRKTKMQAAEAARTIEENSASWQERGGDPYVFEQWLREGAWRPEQIAKHLGCSEREAQAILWAYGFEEGGDGSWRVGQSQEARLQQGNLRLIISSSISRATDDELHQVFTRRAEAMITSGQAPVIDWEGLDWLNPGR